MAKVVVSTEDVMVQKNSKVPAFVKALEIGNCEKRTEDRIAVF